MRICSVEGCGGVQHAKGLCTTHYSAQRYAAKRDDILAKAKKYYQERGRDKLSERRRQNGKPPVQARTGERLSMTELNRRWRKKHPDTYRALRRRQARKGRKILSPRYIKRLLFRRGGVSRALTPAVLIEAKAAHIAVHRKLKEIERHGN